MRWRGDIQYASRVDSPLVRGNPLQEVLQGLLQAATGTREDFEAALALTADPVLAGKDDGWDLRSRRLKGREVANCLTFWTALSVGNRWSPVILAMHVHDKRGLSFPMRSAKKRHSVM
jgi:hypothetical protein